MDVNRTFLHGDIKYEIYMKYPNCFILKGNNYESICKMKISMYGLNHSLRMCHKKFDTYKLGLSFTRSKAYYYLYFKLVGDHFIYVASYGDDMFLFRKNVEIIEK